MGEPIDLRRFIEENPKDSDEVIARKVRSTLHHHLTRETRAVFGPPLKPTERLIDETLRDRQLRKVLDAHAASTNRRQESVYREARRNLLAIASRPSPTTLAFASSSTPTTCPANGARQLYVVRDLTDPTPRPAVCACSGG